MRAGALALSFLTSLWATAHEARVAAPAVKPDSTARRSPLPASHAARQGHTGAYPGAKAPPLGVTTLTAPPPGRPARPAGVSLPVMSAAQALPVEPGSASKTVKVSTAAAPLSLPVSPTSPADPGADYDVMNRPASPPAKATPAAGDHYSYATMFMTLVVMLIIAIKRFRSGKA